MSQPPGRIIERIEVESADAVIAGLDCGHRRHVRHRPPLSVHPWVADPSAHAERIGTAIECGRCAALELPANAQPYERTATFDADSLPAALQRDHTTKARTWARIVIEAGEVDYEVFDRTLRLDPAHPGIVPPQVPHRLRLRGPVSLHVEFLRCE